MEEVFKARKNVLIMKLDVLLFLLFAALIGCSSPRGDLVKIIIPNDFQGVFKIVPDDEGIVVEKQDDSFIYRIPESGILKVKNTAPFKVFHETLVEYESGKIVPDGVLDLDKKSIAHYYLWSDTEGRIWFLVGTSEHYQLAQKEGRVKVGEDFLR